MSYSAVFAASARLLMSKVETGQLSVPGETLSISSQLELSSDAVGTYRYVEFVARTRASVPPFGAEYPIGMPVALQPGAFGSLLKDSFGREISFDIVRGVYVKNHSASCPISLGGINQEPYAPKALFLIGTPDLIAASILIGRLGTLCLYQEGRGFPIVEANNVFKMVNEGEVDATVDIVIAGEGSVV